MCFFKKKEVTSQTGIYVIEGKNLNPLNELPKTGSYNHISESFGCFNHHGVNMFDSEKINYIAFKRYTKIPIWVQAKDKTIILSYSDISKAIAQIDWNWETKMLKDEDNDNNDIGQITETDYLKILNKYNLK